MENSQSFCKCYESTILCIDFNFFPQQYFMQDQVFAMVIRNTTKEQLSVLEIRGYVNFQ